MTPRAPSILASALTMLAGIVLGLLGGGMNHRLVHDLAAEVARLRSSSLAG